MPGAEAGQRVLDALRSDERPKLVLWADSDPVLPPETGERFAAALGTESHHVIADASHFLQEDAGPADRRPDRRLAGSRGLSGRPGAAGKRFGLAEAGRRRSRSTASASVSSVRLAASLTARARLAGAAGADALRRAAPTASSPPAPTVSCHPRLVRGAGDVVGMREHLVALQRPADRLRRAPRHDRAEANMPPIDFGTYTS